MNQLQQFVFSRIGRVPTSRTVVGHASNDLTQPATEGLRHTQLIQPREGLNEDVLNQLFRFVPVTQQAASQGDTGILIPLVQSTLRVLVASLSFVDQFAMVQLVMSSNSSLATIISLCFVSRGARKPDTA